ncbi:MAG: sulfotransferase family protein [Gammaproteobacteria bacterium]|nr:sulfotransferase family protein [Gammaproteobacteria bacterium]
MALKLIGAGFGRTGTASLKFALEWLGFGPCYHMMEVMPNPRNVAYWARIARGEQPDWDRIFEGYASTVDFPACSYWRELAAHFPEAKVILSMRDPDRWFESAQRTIFSKAHLDQFLGDGCDPDLRDMVARLFITTFDGHGRDRDHAIAVYNRHNEEVMRTIPVDRLLAFNPEQGWAPLCAFLGVSMPDEPFPIRNTTEEWIARPPVSRNAVP